MHTTNGHGPKRAILYARVSGEEQAKKGYSLADQLDALRRWCSKNGYEIVEEVEDGGYSGAYLERPGLDRVRDMVAGGDADAVVVLFRDRIARGVYAQLLAEEFRDHGARLVALNSRGDDSPDGELGDNILDVIAAWERKKIAERMNRDKRRKVKEGKVVAGPRPNYGFCFNEERDGYLVDEERMAVIRRIFRMVGAEGMTLTNPHRLTRSLEHLLETERQPSAGEDEASWLKRMAEIKLKQERLLDLHLDGGITTERFRAKSAELEEARSRLARLRDIEQSKDALISHYASLVPQALTELTSEDKNQIYKMMRFHVLAQPDGTLIADWGCNILPLPPGSCRTPGR